MVKGREYSFLILVENERFNVGNQQFLRTSVIWTYPSLRVMYSI